jgi:hypothetical protein
MSVNDYDQDELDMIPGCDEPDTGNDEWGTWDPRWNDDSPYRDEDDPFHVEGVHHEVFRCEICDQLKAYKIGEMCDECAASLEIWEEQKK